MSAGESDNSGWDLETSLDVEWAHAIAPGAKILLVEATTPSGANLLKAVDYAAAQSGVVAVSMSWGGAEFPEETSLDSHFASKSGAVFFASAGDNGSGASWPASSPDVVGVGGTSITLNASGTLSKESAWSGSGGGVSAYEHAPAFQNGYLIPKSGGMRAIPDVAYDADPASGFPIIHKGKWQEVGGTSAGRAAVGRDCPRSGREPRTRTSTPIRQRTPARTSATSSAAQTARAATIASRGRTTTTSPAWALRSR